LSVAAEVVVAVAEVVVAGTSSSSGSSPGSHLTDSCDEVLASRSAYEKVYEEVKNTREKFERTRKREKCNYLLVEDTYWLGFTERPIWGMFEGPPIPPNPRPDTLRCCSSRLWA